MVKKYKYNEIKHNYDILKEKRVIIWCRSITALVLYRVLYNQNINVIGFTDSFVNSTGETFAGLPVYTIKEILAMNEVAIYIATNNYNFKQEILEEISAFENIDVFCEGLVYGAGLFNIENMKQIIRDSKEKIEYVRKLLGDERSKEVFEKLLNYRVTNNTNLISEIYESGHNQYFPEDGLIKPVENEIFIDAGAYDGETTYNFSRWICDKNYSKIYVMEPDSLMFQIMKEYISLRRIEKAIPVNRGAYSISGTLKFSEDSSTGSSRINESGENDIKVISIDDMVGDDNVTFIKMDIEGVEMKALEGAQKTIERCKPKLAISIYHKEDDLWEIPYYILKRYPWYTIYIRHYALTTNETVMYATI